MALLFGRGDKISGWLRVRPRSFWDWEKEQGVLTPELCDEHKHEEGTPMLLEPARSAAILLRTPRAIGLRQVFPAQTIKTLTIAPCLPRRFPSKFLLLGCELVALPFFPLFAPRLHHEPSRYEGEPNCSIILEELSRAT